MTADVLFVLFIVPRLTQRCNFKVQVPGAGPTTSTAYSHRKLRYHLTQPLPSSLNQSYFSTSPFYPKPTNTLLAPKTPCPSLSLLHLITLISRLTPKETTRAVPLLILIPRHMIC
ncbi:hypothetical protein Hdeb2414_s0024g00646871 [Helianthus debilis subsp. tardiflorus]